MRRWGLHALQPKAYTPRTTDSTHGLRCAPNRLLDQPKPIQANQVWVSDITYLPLANGNWAYLCAFQDVASKQVVGWQVGATMPEELVTSALQRAFRAQQPTTGLLVHSDRGGHYCGNVYRQLLHDHGAVRSQSRRGDCYDNAQAESLWSRLKTEVLELRERPVFADLADAQVSIADYFDYYNHERLHSSIGYQTPYIAHQQLLQLNALNCPVPRLKKPSPSSRRRRTNEPLPFYRGATGPLSGASTLPGVGRRGQRVLRVATGSAAGSGSDSTDLGNGAGQGIWCP
jgi:transposase InsO family protein